MYGLDWALSTALGGYGSTRLLHGLTAYSLLPLVVLHVVMQWFFGRFWAIFKAQLYRSHVRAGLVSVAVIVPVIGGIYLWNSLPATLSVKYMSAKQTPRLDGAAHEPGWQEATAV